MDSRNDAIQIIGILMKKPTLLSQTDKYNLSISDFSRIFERYLFDAIETLYRNGANRISVIDIENFLEANASGKKVFEQNKGHEYLEDAEEFSDESNFDYYYSHLKKINALKDLKKCGFDISEFYCEDLTAPNAFEINQQFEKLSIVEIFESIKKKILRTEQDYLNDELSATTNVFEGLDDLFEDIGNGADIGMPIQGKIITTVMGGARKGTFMIRSGGSGLGKSRNMVGDACFLAFPYRYNPVTCEWENKGNCEKVLYIATEQSIREIQRMVLAYITGINESKFRYGQFSPLEEIILEEAKLILEKYQDNLMITQMPGPTNELIKNVIREQCILNEIEYVFFDYIFISPPLLKEFRGFNLRNDELLLMLSTTLKDLATELNVFVMTATQVNAAVEDNKDIRNEASLAGGRSTINKADYGFIMARPTKEELGVLEPITVKLGIEPNLVTDVFKVRAGEWTQVRIWSYFDAGILRKEDLFLTDSKLYPIDMSNSYTFDYQDWESEDYLPFLNELNERLVK